MRKFDTVFNKINPEGMHPNEILAIVFHRSAFILYCMYAIWGIVSVFANYHEFATEPSHDFGDFFQMLVPPVAVVAAIGALHFPKWGRMEMFAASALATLIVVFLIIYTIQAISHPELPRLWANLVLNTTHLVVPVMRAGFVFRTLVWESMITSRKKGNA